MTTHIITLTRTRNVINNDHVNIVFSYLKMFILKKSIFKGFIPFHFKGSFYKQNFTLVVISYDIYERSRILGSLISYEMTTSVRSSKYDVYSTRTLDPLLMLCSCSLRRLICTVYTVVTRMECLFLPPLQIIFEYKPMTK